jgi:hypothetical protein
MQWLVYRGKELGPSRSFGDQIDFSECSRKAQTLLSDALDLFRRKCFQPGIINRDGAIVKKLAEANDRLNFEQARVAKEEVTVIWHEARNREFIQLLEQTSNQSVTDQQLSSMLDTFIGRIG